jgi:hypothetical protein
MGRWLKTGSLKEKENKTEAVFTITKKQILQVSQITYNGNVQGDSKVSIHRD